MLLIASAAVLATLIFASRHFMPIPEEIIWEVAGGRLIACRDGFYLVDDGGEVRLMDSHGTAQSVAPLDRQERLALRSGGEFRLRVASVSERVVSVLDDDTVLTQKQSQGGQFGEPWDLSLYGPSGKRVWTSPLPGVIAAASAVNDRLAVAISDLSAGSMPALALLDRKDGKMLWMRALQPGSWRTLGSLEDGTAVAALTSYVTAFAPDGSLAWSFDPAEDILSAAVVGKTTCISTRANRGLLALVDRYEVTALSPGGVAMWSTPVRYQPLGLQQWMGKEAVIAIAENHVLGLKIRDGARLFAERTGANPVDLTGDKLLIRDNRGVRLVRLQSVRLPAV